MYHPHRQRAADKKRAGRQLPPRKAREGGQAIVEFALALPLLMLVLCAIIDFGWLYLNEFKAEQAAYEGARCASINHDSTDLLSLVETRVSQTVDGADVEVCLTDGNAVVTVTVTVPTITFVAGIIYGQKFTATAEGVAAY
jgi:Flp pilus assembly protein TadG